MLHCIYLGFEVWSQTDYFSVNNPIFYILRTLEESLEIMRSSCRQSYQGSRALLPEDKNIICNLLTTICISHVHI